MKRFWILPKERHKNARFSIEYKRRRKGRLQTEILLRITKMAPPKLNKDGTERKTKASKQQPTGTGGPTKAQLEAQRNAMRETLKQLKEKRDTEDDEAFEIGSVYDLALGLELWLTDNSKVRPCLRAIRGRFLVWLEIRMLLGGTHVQEEREERARWHFLILSLSL